MTLAAHRSGLNRTEVWIPQNPCKTGGYGGQPVTPALRKGTQDLQGKLAESVSSRFCKRPYLSTAIKEDV